jgi:transcriptional regulator with XRE-family HTH domain
MQSIRIGKVFQLLRHVAGVTQEDVCAQASISINFLSQLENGRKDMSHAVAGRLAAVLGVPVSFLYVLAVAGHPAVEPLYGVVRQELERVIAARVGARLEGSIEFRTEQEKRCYWDQRGHLNRKLRF